MFCMNCGSKLREDDYFCQRCNRYTVISQSQSASRSGDLSYSAYQVSAEKQRRVKLSAPILSTQEKSHIITVSCLFILLGVIGVVLSMLLIESIMQPLYELIPELAVHSIRLSFNVLIAHFVLIYIAFGAVGLKCKRWSFIIIRVLTIINLGYSAVAVIVSVFWNPLFIIGFSAELAISIAICVLLKTPLDSLSYIEQCQRQEKRTYIVQ